MRSCGRHKSGAPQGMVGHLQAYCPPQGDLPNSHVVTTTTAPTGTLALHSWTKYSLSCGEYDTNYYIIPKCRRLLPKDEDWILPHTDAEHCFCSISNTVPTEYQISNKDMSYPYLQNIEHSQTKRLSLLNISSCLNQFRNKPIYKASSGSLIEALWKTSY